MPGLPESTPIANLEIPLDQTTGEIIGKGLAHLLASPGDQSLQRSYPIDAGVGIEAELKLHDGVSTQGYEQLVPEAVIIKIGDDTIRVSVATKDCDLMSGYVEYPKSLAIREITHKRSVKLKDGTRVTKSITYGRVPKQEPGKPDGSLIFLPDVLRETTKITKGLRRTPILHGHKLTIPVDDDWGDHWFYAEPDLVRYELSILHTLDPLGFPDTWDKTYALLNDEGYRTVIRPASEDTVFVSRKDPKVPVRNAPVSEAELRNIQRILTTAGNLCSPDISLTKLIDTEITPHQPTLDRLIKKHAADQTKLESNPYDDEDKIFYGLGEPDDDET